jgi:hypothetical protein
MGPIVQRILEHYPRFARILACILPSVVVAFGLCVPQADWMTRPQRPHLTGRRHVEHQGRGGIQLCPNIRLGLPCRRAPHLAVRIFARAHFLATSAIRPAAFEGVWEI